MIDIIQVRENGCLNQSRNNERHKGQVLHIFLWSEAKGFVYRLDMEKEIKKNDYNIFDLSNLK